MGSVSISTEVQANDVTCMACCCVCFHCNQQTTSHGLLLRVYASQWNWACTAFEHVERKTEEVVFSRRNWLSFIVGVRSELVRSYDRHLPEVLPWLHFTPDPQQVQVERFSLSCINYTNMFEPNRTLIREGERERETERERGGRDRESDEFTSS